MLYIFAGFPRNSLTAGGLAECIENAEMLGLLEHGEEVQLRRSGRFQITPYGNEVVGPVKYLLSSTLEAEGITWDWFPDDFTFGNGVTIHKTIASPEIKTVVYGTNLSMDEFLTTYGPTGLGSLKMTRSHQKRKGWLQYEARWLPGTCPQENHIVHLTWVITIDPLPGFAYERLKAIVEGGADVDKDRYLDSHFHPTHTWNGAPAFAKMIGG